MCLCSFQCSDVCKDLKIFFFLAWFLGCEGIFVLTLFGLQVIHSGFDKCWVFFLYFFSGSSVFVEADLIEEQRGRRGLPQEAGGQIMLTFSPWWG